MTDTWAGKPVETSADGGILIPPDIAAGLERWARDHGVYGWRWRLKRFLRRWFGRRSKPVQPMTITVQQHRPTEQAAYDSAWIDWAMYHNRPPWEPPRTTTAIKS